MVASMVVNSLQRNISPPPSRSSGSARVSGKATLSIGVNGGSTQSEDSQSVLPSPAAIEAGRVQIRNHLDHFTEHLNRVSRPLTYSCPRIDIAGFESLYRRSEHSHGRHFVIHQHDHPISGVHYDLRLQFSKSSTVSWSIPYGIPGNPNSMRPNRMAIETRVHTLWNNLIESASHATGSLLIWDTGEYEVMARAAPKSAPPRYTDDESSNREEGDTYRSKSASRCGAGAVLPENEKLIRAFHSRHIKLRLRGTRLPKDYTVSLRLPSANDRIAQPSRPKRKRRRVELTVPAAVANAVLIDSEDERDSAPSAPVDVEGFTSQKDAAAAVASDDDEDEQIRLNNAYPGADNTINSVHQRHWFLTLDRTASGCHKVRTGTERGRWKSEWEPFFVLGRDFERSVVTGRNADEVMEDEGVEKFAGRKMWRPIVE